MMIALAKKTAEMATEKTAAIARVPMSLLNMIWGPFVKVWRLELSEELWASWQDRCGHESG